MGRKKKEMPVEAEPVLINSGSVVEYRPVGEKGPWRVESFGLFTAEMDLGTIGVADLPMIHGLLQRTPRSWFVVRRLFGFMPVVLPLATSMEEWRRLERPEVCEALGIDRDELKQELLAVRSLLAGKVGTREEEIFVGGSMRPESRKAEAAEENGELGLADDHALLREFGYPERMFQVMIKPLVGEPVPRPSDENKMERAWFAGRVRQFEKALRDPVAGRLADQLLRNELRLRRVEHELSATVMGSKDEAAYLETKDTLEKTLERQLEKLQEVAPWFNTSEKQVLARDAFSEVIRAMQEYHRDGSNQLVDGLWTALQLQVLIRTSAQKAEPDYRWGFNMYIQASRAGLWDPNWKSRFLPKHLAKLDAGFKEGVKRYVEATDEHVPDLLKEGEMGEFEDLYLGDGVHRGAAEGAEGMGK